MTQSGIMFLCRYDADSYVLKRWERNRDIVMRSSAAEIDQLMQEFMVASGRYDLSVFRFTKEQEETLLIKKLKGY